MTRRLTSRSLAGTSRKLVAVGTSRLAAMLATMRAPAPRMGSPTTSAGAAVGAAAGAGAASAVAGAVAAAGAAAAASRAAGGLGLGVPAVVGEEVAPALAHRGRVGEVLLVHLVDQPGVGPEGARRQVVAGGGVIGHGTDRTGGGIHHPTARRG